MRSIQLALAFCLVVGCGGEGEEPFLSFPLTGPAASQFEGDWYGMNGMVGLRVEDVGGSFQIDLGARQIPETCRPLGVVARPEKLVVQCDTPSGLKPFSGLYFEPGHGGADAVLALSADNYLIRRPSAVWLAARSFERKSEATVEWFSRL